METLLEKIGLINFKYEKLNYQDRFNVFSILFKKSDEVNLHSKFISELLNKNGTHGQKDIFAKLFLETIEIDTFQWDNYQVQREYKNIDLLLTNAAKAIIIENKIWAGDQDKQLERYYKQIEAENFEEIHIFYLTIWGTEPSERSLGELIDRKYVGLISYNYHISKWLDKCIEVSSRFPTLRETLVQYQNIVNELTGKSMGQEQKDEVIKLLSQNDNIIKAHSIAENWNHVKWYTEWNFWNELEGVISKDYRILNFQKYSTYSLDSVIHQSRNRNAYYGIMFEIGEYKDNKICVFIERGWTELYYGLTIQQNGDRSITDKDEFSGLASRIEKYCDWGREGFWLGGMYFLPNINFENFSDENTLRLSNDDFRKKTIYDNWIKIKEFIYNCTLQFQTIY